MLELSESVSVCNWHVFARARTGKDSGGTFPLSNCEVLQLERKRRTCDRSSQYVGFRDAEV